MGESEDSAPGGKALGTIPLKQVRVTRAEMEERASANPMNRLVPYLDLFSRLSDVELARLAVVGPEIVNQLRQQVVQVDAALRRYVDLLPRLGDDELVRLSGASSKTIRFWRLCQGPPARATAPTEADAVARAVRSRAETAPHRLVPDAPAGPHPAAQPTRPAPVVDRPPPGEPPTPAMGMPVVPARRPTPGLGAPAVGAPPAVGTPGGVIPPNRQPTPAPGDLHPAQAAGIDIDGTPFPGYDYDPEEAIPDEFSVDLPD